MDGQNLAYALGQVAHNFGAMAVVALPLWGARAGGAARLLWLTLAGWAVQVASGAGFGLVSLHYYGQLPDIHGVAVAALALKLLCALLAAVLILRALLRARAGAGGSARAPAPPWSVLAALGATALTAAAFLRWFS